MSIHSSLRGIDTLKGERSVLTRIERIQQLQKNGKFDAKTQSALGLPKVRTKFKLLGGKKRKAEGEAAPAAAAAATAAAPAAPAAKGKAKGGKK